ncbi:phosphomannomutase/phosphoglucomutase [Candidatus Poseidoniales archaeon]|nr:phosphomannomutase/phosphoglucomutase [Candidatus Poseidoniales archaeon]MDB2367319.1 phosphomannomutase/phosphoglucomutase [Candidatus Poseidoniales archaeon]MDB2671716.1 phosphomannomutase/phosphoglucomutase [Candidatus Poseidoniales archaeon]
MTEWPESCFKAYDIRGLSGEELSDEFAYRLGRAIAAYLECDSFAVGRDIRKSSPGYASNLIQGLVDSGVRVLDLGIVSTGCLYHACWTLPVDGGVMVTASHLPMPTHNGFKMCRGTLPLAGEEIQELKGVFLEGNFSDGEGEHIDHPHEDTYLNAIVASTGTLARPVKVAVDCGNAVPGPAMSKLLDMIGAEHIDLYCDWDNTEPNHGADPTREYNMIDLAKAVVDNGYELGLGADGDGDRIGAVDEKGNFVYPDRLIALLADDVVGTEEGKDLLIYDVKCSMNVEKAIIEAGGRPMMAKTGHSFMKRVLAENSDALMAAEMSGHIFMADRGWYGFDCSLYNAARILELWSRRDALFSEELNRLAPNLPTTGEVKVPCPEEKKLEIVSAITEAFGDYESSTIDGVRVRFTEDGEQQGWYLARKSNTEPILVMRVEAVNEEKLHEMLSLIDSRVSSIINIEKLLA